jgi:hypothetical protein
MMNWDSRGWLMVGFSIPKKLRVNLDICSLKNSKKVKKNGRIIIRPHRHFYTVYVSSFNEFNLNLVERGGLDAESFAAKLFDTGNFNPSSAYSSSRLLEDLGDPKLGELLYSDLPLSSKEMERKSNWLHEAYGTITEKSAHKTQLLKLVEYNKIEICENDGFLEQKTDIEEIICKLMRQRLINDELKHDLDSH